MAIGDLTTLANAKSWLSNVSTNDDALLSRLISAASGTVIQYLNKHIIYNTYTQTFNGNGMTSMALPEYPIYEVVSLSIDGVTISPSTNGINPGYMFDANMVYLIGTSSYGFTRCPIYRFTKGFQNVVITYKAGFYIPSDVQVIPPIPYTIIPAYFYSADLGVSFISGTALVKVDSSPAINQYMVSNAGLYTFNIANVGQSVSLSYSTVPFDVEQATLELLSLRYRERAHIGVNSKSIGQETISYSREAMSDSIKALLNNYKKVALV